MQHTEKYNFSLIDADDAFSPDALNVNARQLEDQLARVEDSLTAEIARLDAAAAAEQTRVNGEITKLNTAIGAGGTTARIVYGKYTGNNTYGKNNPNRLDFAGTLGTAPKLLIVVNSTSSYRLILVQGSSLVENTGGANTCHITWSGTAVQWYSDIDSVIQMNLNHTYYYVAFA